MRTSQQMQHRTGGSQAALFAELVAPLGFIGEAVYAGVAGVGRKFARTFRAIEVTVREHKAVACLSELDDRTLKDIGVQRSEIRYLAHRVARAKGIDYKTFLRR